MEPAARAVYIPYTTNLVPLAPVRRSARGGRLMRGHVKLSGDLSITSKLSDPTGNHPDRIAFIPSRKQPRHGRAGAGQAPCRVSGRLGQDLSLIMDETF